MSREIILAQAKATHQSQDFTTGAAQVITDIETIVTEQVRSQVKHQNASATSDSTTDSETDIGTDIGVETEAGPEFVGVWGEIRKRINAFVGHNNYNKTFLSKLETEIDESKLTAPSTFHRDYIKQHFGQLLRMFVGGQNYSFEL